MANITGRPSVGVVSSQCLWNSVVSRAEARVVLAEVEGDRGLTLCLPHCFQRFGHNGRVGIVVA